MTITTAEGIGDIQQGREWLDAQSRGVVTYTVHAVLWAGNEAVIDSIWTSLARAKRQVAIIDHVLTELGNLGYAEICREHNMCGSWL